MPASEPTTGVTAPQPANPRTTRIHVARSSFIAHQGHRLRRSIRTISTCPGVNAHEREDIMSTNRKDLALAYLNAVGRQQYDTIEALLAPDVQFRGPSMTRA